MKFFSVAPSVWIKPDGSTGVIPSTDYVYDEESYPNVFTCTILHPVTGSVWQFEVSDRCNDSRELMTFVFAASKAGCRFVGFNNVGYDSQVLEHCIAVWRQLGCFTAAHAYEKNTDIIGRDWNDRFAGTVAEWNMTVKQVDLYLIHHFDNKNKRTGLKHLEFCMRSENVGDLPFPPGTILTPDQIDELLHYNAHDVFETCKFYVSSLEAIEFRDELAASTGMQCTNYNDTKIGKEYFRMKLEAVTPGITGTRSSPARTPRQQIALADVILPIIRFESDEFNGALAYLKRTVLTNTNKPPELDNLSVTFNGFQFDFGAGGIHGSLKRRIIRPGSGERLIDIDVKSFYPNIPISFRFFPQHLSELFCDVNKELFDRRAVLSSSVAENRIIKLALNGVYGDSNNVYSKGFYDPQYTMAVTVNGQLLLSMLAEWLSTRAHCRLVQINTDGMTLLVPDSHNATFRDVCAAWEAETRLKLEDVEYSQMIIRDVNNYIAVDKAGKVKKRKGAYQWKTDKPTNLNESLNWHQDWSALVAPMAAEMQMVHGINVRDFVHNHDDAFDFMLKAKAPGKGHLELDYGGDRGTKLQKVTRYHIARHGPGMRSVHPPLAKAPDKIRNISIQAGYSVQVCDHVRDFDPANLNHDWYVKEAEKLII
jgi:hypothetical protein